MEENLIKKNFRELFDNGNFTWYNAQVLQKGELSE